LLPLGRRLVDAGDQVTGLHAGAEGRRALDRRHHLDQALFHLDLDADTGELAADAFAEFLETLAVEILRVRIEPRHHAADGVTDQLLLVHRLDVGALDQIEHCGELLHLFKRQRRGRAACSGLQLHRRERSGDGTDCHPSCYLEFGTHYHMHLSRQYGTHTTNFLALSIGRRDKPESTTD
jgi:hypothetical protein